MIELTEIGAKSYSECQLLMLSSQKESVLSKGLNVPKLFHCPKGIMYDKTAEEYQHLYVVSESDEIEDLNYYIWTDNKVICSAPSTEYLKFLRTHQGAGHIKKIIATTDKSLHLPFVTPGNEELDVYEYKTLPGLSKSFMNKFVSEFNQGNKISNILVEYLEKLGTGCEQMGGSIELKLTKSNNIRICKSGTY